MKIFYKNVDITDSIHLLKCVHDMHASGQADTLRLMIDDEKKRWDNWNPKKEDEIKIISDDVETGTMFVVATSFEDGFLNLTAASTPMTFFDKKVKTWNDITFMQIAKDIAAAHGLKLKIYKVENKKYKQLQQEYESDAAFLNRRCILEGCAFLVFDKTLVLYNEKAMEETTPVKTIEMQDDEIFQLAASRIYGSCSFAKGKYKGQYKTSKGPLYVPDMPFTVSSNAEANRFAKNLLRFANKNQTSGYKEMIGIDKGCAPGSVIEVKSSQAKSWDGPVFLYRVRNDYINSKSKLFFRKPIKEY